VQSHLNRFPDMNKYTELTWEWTIGRDYKDRVFGMIYYCSTSNNYTNNLF
jgi:hypothetical protein